MWVGLVGLVSAACNLAYRFAGGCGLGCSLCSVGGGHTSTLQQAQSRDLSRYAAFSAFQKIPSLRAILKMCCRGQGT